MEAVTFDRPFRKVSASAKGLYTIYALETPLQPGETMKMSFRVGYASHGFKDGNERAELAYNGMFFDSNYFPYIGYNSNVELDDPRRRKEEKTGPAAGDGGRAAIPITTKSACSRAILTGSITTRW